jgi:hypothetical protein
VSLFKALHLKEWPNPISIGITTFEKRFETYFIPLLKQLRAIDSEIEIVVAVNGEHQRAFSESYRTALLQYLSTHPTVFPIFFPQFRGLAKLWNSIIIHASNDHILMLNDDVSITHAKFLSDVKKAIYRNKGRSFTINQSWSHFVVQREEIDKIGYFDERLLGIGEEDGDMTWRYLAECNVGIGNMHIKGILNHSESTMNEAPLNIECRGESKYSQFNRKFVYEQKYQLDPKGIKGMFDAPMTAKNPTPRQYPNERFYRENRDKL